MCSGLKVRGRGGLRHIRQGSPAVDVTAVNSHSGQIPYGPERAHHMVLPMSGRRAKPLSDSPTKAVSSSTPAYSTTLAEGPGYGMREDRVTEGEEDAMRWHASWRPARMVRDGVSSLHGGVAHVIRVGQLDAWKGSLLRGGVLETAGRQLELF